MHGFRTESTGLVSRTWPLRRSASVELTYVGPLVIVEQQFPKGSFCMIIPALRSFDEVDDAVEGDQTLVFRRLPKLLRLLSTTVFVAGPHIMRVFLAGSRMCSTFAFVSMVQRRVSFDPSH